MCETPLFSIIIPTFNRRELLAIALDSVLAQRGCDFEIFVVDDGSSDKTPEYVKSIGSRVKLLEQSRAGPGAARNLAAKSASGRYLAFLDSDDLWFPWTLEVYREVIRTWPEPSFVAGKPKQFADERELTTVTVDSVQANRFS